MNAVEALDELIEQLDGVQQLDESGSEKGVAAADAIDRVLASSPRKTEVRSLRRDAAVEGFRRELVDGLIRVDTAGRLLRLLSQVVGAVLSGRV